jgi:hypothetical protein
MPYLLNVLSIGNTTSAPFYCGKIVAEPDDPPLATIDSGERYSGTRHLIVYDDGTTYRSGMAFVRVPENINSPAHLAVPRVWRGDFERLLRQLLANSPQQELILYLEANRIISRPGKDEPFPVVPDVFGPISLTALLSIIYSDAFREEVLYFVNTE